MKHSDTLKTTLLLLSLVFTLQTIAQTYTPPSRERVETLLEQIEECKEHIAVTESAIKAMEKDPTSYTLADYVAAEKYLRLSKKCVEVRRKELDSLRKEYPGWFNSPSATVTIKKGRHISPKELEDIMERVQKQINKVLKAFGSVDKPQH
ncbi:hypothetical protein [Algibacter sp. 2305UL17-15]|uniref:hypothetical protein n=1 Tax=Algibacter sp. 2305UL17-15 TaxID=3231268 RepID=UPI00345852B8